MNHRSIRRFWAVVFALLVLEVVVGLAVWQWPRFFASRYASDLYRTYADIPGIDATFLHDYRVSDTVAVDVTILQATDSVGWERLTNDFGIISLPKEALEFLGQDSNMTTFKRVSRTDLSPMEEKVSEDYFLLVVQNFKHRIFVFPIEDDTQLGKIFHKKYIEIKR